MASSSGTGRRPDLSRALAQYRERADRYDAELGPYEPLRIVAIERLGPQAGQTVLDVGCGTGLSFASLEQGVGPQGRVIGIEPCAEMLALARARTERNRWRNVTLVPSPAGQAEMPTQADAALFHFTHDVLRDAAAVRHVLAGVRPGGRVVAAGLCWSAPWNWPTNGLVLLAALYSVTSLDGLHAPWSHLAEHLAGLEIETPMPGFYVASGTLRKGARAG